MIVRKIIPSLVTLVILVLAASVLTRVLKICWFWGGTKGHIRGPKARAQYPLEKP